MPGTQLASYAFTTNENPLSNGGNFSTLTGTTGMEVVSNLAQVPTLSVNCGSLYTAISPPGDHYAELKVAGSVAANSNGIQCVIRGQTGAHTYYLFSVNAGATSTQMYRCVAGVFTELPNTATLGSLTLGDTFRFVGSGSLLTAFQNGTQVLQNTDANITGGTFGIGGFNNGVITNCRASLWAGGTAVISTPSFSPSPGTFTMAQTVTLSSDAGATITYTTDGSTPIPGSHGTVYTVPFTVASTQTINAIASATNYTNSAQGQGLYTISSGKASRSARSK